MSTPFHDRRSFLRAGAATAAAAAVTAGTPAAGSATTSTTGRVTAGPIATWRS